MQWLRFGVLGSLLTASAPAEVELEARRPALSVRPIRPDLQLARFLALFEGSPYPHPAAALAAWKQGTGGHLSLGKSWEAAIAAFNPSMVRELRILDSSELVVSLGQPRGWYLVVPEDDGTLAALASALVLTGGARDSAVGKVPVDRLGPPGAAVLARWERGVVVAGRREELESALHALRTARRTQVRGCDSGWTFQLDPQALGAPNDLLQARLAEGLRAIGCRSMEGFLALEGESLSAVVTANYAAPLTPTPSLDPEWLDLIPAEGTVAAVALAIDPRADAWDRLFTLADRLEKADPARAKTAPLRTRLNLLALSVGVRPEVDFWPRLRGLSLFLKASRPGRIDGALVALHTNDAGAAEALARDVLPRMARLLAPDRAAASDFSQATSLGIVLGQPLLVCRRERTVLIGWGAEALRAGLDAAAHAERSAGPCLRASWQTSRPQRAGAVWPGRLADVLPKASPLGPFLDHAPPVIWHGTNIGPTSRDEVRLDGLRGVIRNALARLPQGPPPTP
jgi:hypothetical protein